MINSFKGYTITNGYVDGFPLLSTFKAPKPCAGRSAISSITPKYYIG
jgi:hypothetical protein